MKIAIASGKGGTGKTLVSTNLYNIITKDYSNCVLLDCDAEEPNDLVFFDTKLQSIKTVNQDVPVIDESKCTYCGKCYDYCNYNAIFILPQSKIIKVIDDLCHSCGACSVACNYNAISQKEVLLGNVNTHIANTGNVIIEGRTKVGVYSPIPIIKSLIKEAEKFDYVILDSPPGTSCPFIQTVTSADFVILVTEPTPFGLSDLKQSIETLDTMNKKCAVIINKADLGDSEIYNYLDSKKIEILMEIPFDREIANYYSKGELFSDYMTEWKEKFLLMFQQIEKKYGNSNN